ncbi:MAG: hypothetical protein KJN95_00830 [Gammaproteobacteria bacterium]|nr:hypothetical protein [Gammaproteobacteria bacterium]MBT8436278.1 hypothetical protein [Gammaproteobacteria bacterium]
MTFFLKLRHWELFLMLALPTILSLMFKIPFGPLVSASVGLFILLVLFAWMFSIGTWSNRHLPESRRRSIFLFGISLALPIIYVLMYIILYIPLLQNGGPSRPPLWLLPMHMFSMLGIFYGIWYTARQLKSLLENEDADFMIFSSTFFLLFIFPIGIWLIQPEVNQLYNKLEQSNPDADGS